MCVFTVHTDLVVIAFSSRQRVTVPVLQALNNMLASDLDNGDSQSINPQCPYSSSLVSTHFSVERENITDTKSTSAWFFACTEQL